MEHAANVLNNYAAGSDGQTPYRRLHGHEIVEELLEFGEHIQYYVPKRARSILDGRWLIGQFLGTASGGVVRAREISRLVEDRQWNPDALLNIKGTSMQPLEELADDYDRTNIESITQPHDREDARDDGNDVPTIARRTPRLVHDDFVRYGYTDACPRCDMHRAG